MPAADDELRVQLAEFVGRELGVAELERAAAVVTRHYRERGRAFARAYVPAQDMRSGIVEIEVLVDDPR